MPKVWFIVTAKFVVFSSIKYPFESSVNIWKLEVVETDLAF